jgi:hypothetical protein
VKLSIATFCDRATVREGLLHVLGAGVTRVTVRPPSALPIDLALIVSAQAEDVGKHELSIVFSRDAGERFGEIKAQWIVSKDQFESEPVAVLPLTIPLHSFGPAKAGLLRAEIALDGNSVDTMQLVVRYAEPEVEQPEHPDHSQG